jgi:glycosyltransferase involved in cell wall biosynthesis
VPNGVDLQPFRQAIQPLERSAIGLSDEDVVLIYVGRLGPEKNLPFLLRSFAGTIQAFNHARLILVGDGPEYDDLQNRVRDMGIKSHVHFTGMVPYEEIPRYLALADAFVTPSVTEVHPLSIIEAMAAGLPTLGIQSPGVGDTIQDGETGFLAPEVDLASFTAKMVRLVVNHEERRQMGAQARQTADQYAIEQTTQLMLKRYQNVISMAEGRSHGWRARFMRWWDRLQR